MLSMGYDKQFIFRGGRRLFLRFLVWCFGLEGDLDAHAIGRSV